MRTLALLGAVAMFAAACGSGDETGEAETPDETDETTDEGTEGEGEGDEQAAGDASCGTTDLVWAHEQEPPDMHLDDPNNNLSITSWIRQSMWEGLYGVTAATTFFPELLAGEMEVTDNGDGTFTYAGTLRDGLTWSDGTALTTEQVIGTIDIILEGYDAEAEEPGGTYLIGSRLGYDQITEYSASSDTEFSFTTEGFFAGYKALVSEVFPTHVVADAEAANTAFPEFEADGSALPSSGPMLWGEWNRGTSMSLTTNDSYHGSVSPDVSNDGVACVTGVQINFVADTDTQINALTAGEADIIFTQPQLQFETGVADNPSFTVASEAGPVFEHWGLNVYNDHLADPLVREALALAMNKAEVMTGLYTPLFGDILPEEGLGNVYWMSNQPDYVNNAGNAGYGQGDVDGAIANLEEAGYADGDGDGVVEHPERGPLSLRVGTTGGNGLREVQQELLQTQFAAAGIEITIDNVDGGAYFSERPFAPAAVECSTSGGTDGDCTIWDITQFAWVGGPWPGSGHSAYLSGSGNNPYGYANPDFDAKAAECDAIVDDAERATCYNELDAFVTTLGPDGNGLITLPLTQKPSFYAYSNERLVGAAVSPDANSAGPLVNVVDYQPAG